MVTGLTLSQNAVQLEGNCVVNFWGGNKTVLTGVCSRVRESLA